MYNHILAENTKLSFAHDPPPPSVAQPLTGAYKRVYLVRATPSPKFLAPLGTSGILKTLYETAVSVRLSDERKVNIHD